MSRTTVLLLPGQGAYLPGALRSLSRGLPEVERALAVVDDVSVRAGLPPVSGVVTGESPPGLEHLLLDEPPHILQLTLYASAVGMYRSLVARGLQPAGVAGHSLGEIAALVCGGAFTVAQGAEIVLLRTATVGEANPGGAMVALDQPAARAQQLLDAVGDPDAVVAADNGPRQSVVSGPDAAVEAVEAVARALRISAVRLRSPFPFHSPLLSGASRELARRLSHLPQQPLTTRVYSPVLGRWYSDDDVLTDALAGHLTAPVGFRAALEALHADGADGFVEAGVGATLGKLVAASLPDVAAVSCVDGSGEPLQSFEAAVDRLVRTGALAPPAAADVATLLLPDVDEARRRAFWAARGDAVLAHVRAELAGLELAPAPVPQVPRGAAVPRQDAVPAPRPATAEPAPATPRTPQGPARPARGDLVAELAEMYAAALEYPVEVFTEDVELEADLGVDSVKQTELLSRAADRYSLPDRPADFRLSECSTLGKVADFVLAGIDAAPAEARPAAA